MPRISKTKSRPQSIEAQFAYARRVMRDLNKMIDARNRARAKKDF